MICNLCKKKLPSNSMLIQSAKIKRADEFGNINTLFSMEYMICRKCLSDTLPEDMKYPAKLKQFLRSE